MGRQATSFTLTLTLPLPYPTLPNPILLNPEYRAQVDERVTLLSFGSVRPNDALSDAGTFSVRWVGKVASDPKPEPRHFHLTPQKRTPP